MMVMHFCLIGLKGRKSSTKYGKLDIKRKKMYSDTIILVKLDLMRNANLFK